MSNSSDIIELCCPHCSGQIIIYKNEINCGIFRHGIFKDSGLQIDSHGSKEYCDNLVISNSIHGCSKPFKLLVVDCKIILEICPYI